jgi:hypothetical protein
MQGSRNQGETMTVEPRRRRSRFLWAALGATVLIGAVIALLLSAGGKTENPPSSSRTTGQAITPEAAVPVGDEEVVDPGVVARGWVPEPITRDPDVYVRAALEAAGTVDTRKATRAQWVTWLDTWFTPSPLYDNHQDALDQMAGYQAELNQSVVMPQQMWDDLAREDGRVTAHVFGDIHYLKLPTTTALRMWTATADVVMSYTRTADGGDVHYDETVHVSVQVVCDGQSTPTPGSAQRAGDCKVVRYFDAAVS